MKKTTANKIDQNIINKMSHDSNFAYKYLKNNDAVINSFNFFFNKYAMTKRGFVSDELFHDFLVYMLGIKNKIAMYDSTKSEFITWISKCINHFILSNLKSRKEKMPIVSFEKIIGDEENNNKSEMEMTDEMIDEMTDDEMTDEMIDEMIDEMTDEMIDEMTDEMIDEMIDEKTDKKTDKKKKKIEKKEIPDYLRDSYIIGNGTKYVNTDIYNIANDDFYKITGESEEDRIKYIENAIQYIKNPTYQTILRESLINYLLRKDRVEPIKSKKELLNELGIDSSTFSTYKKRAFRKIASILEDKGILLYYQTEYILESLREKQKTEEPRVLGFMTTMSCLTTMPTTNSPYQWLVEMLRKMAAEFSD